MFASEADPVLVDNCIFVTGANSSISYNLTGSIDYAPLYAPAQLNSPPISVKVQNHGPSDASNVVLSHLFSPTVNLITILPLSSENLGSIGPGQTATISYYLNIPATPNTSYDGAWTLSKGGYFNGTVNVFVTTSINGNVTGLTPVTTLSFTSIVDYVCHHHTNCANCLQGKKNYFTEYFCMSFFNFMKFIIFNFFNFYFIFNLLTFFFS